MASMTVYEKPTCTTCRRVLALLRDRGAEIERIDYHVRGLREDELRDLMAKAGVRPRELLRLREPLVKELGLDDPDLDDDALLRAMAANPPVVERPIVVRGERAVLARPPERALELLD